MNAQAYSKKLPIHEVLQNENKKFRIKSIQYLLNQHHIQTPGFDVDSIKDQYGIMLLFRAIQGGHSDIVKILLEHGANPHILITPFMPNAASKSTVFSGSILRWACDTYEYMLEHANKYSLDTLTAFDEIIELLQKHA